MTTEKQPPNEILKALTACRSVFWSVAAFSAVINLLMLAPAVYMLQVYDRVLASQNKTTLLMLTLILLGLFVLMSLLEHLRSWAMIRLGAWLDMRLNHRVYTASFQANLRQGSFNATQAMNDLTSLRQFITGSALFAFFDAPWFPVYLAVIFMFDPWLGSFALAGSLVLLLLAFLNERLSAQPLKEAGKLSIQSGHLAGTTLRNAEVIEAMGMLPALRQRWFGVHEQFLDQHRIASERAATLTAITKGTRIALQSLVLGIAALLVVDGKISAGMMIAASILMGRALSPIEGVIGAWKQWAGAREAYDRLGQLLTAFPSRPAALSLPRPTGSLQVEQLSAAVPGSRTPVLAQLNFRLEPGQVLGVIGPSGSGKSTLARLLVGVWPSVTGKVRLDGADIYRWNKEELGNALGYLPQDVELFAGSIGDNIARFGQPDPEKIIAAARLAGVHELILRFPQGYDTLLGENGAGLSGGQKQRIGLARALYGNPALLVLDEPNSNLDEAGEAALLMAVQQMKEQGCTVVLITHRSAVLAAATHLLVLQAGQMLAFGPRPDVMEQLQKRAKTNAAPSYGMPLPGYTSPQPRVEEAEK